MIIKDQLKQYIENIEHLENEKNKISEQISDIYKTAKIKGFNTKIMKKLIQLRRKTIDEIAEENILLETYAEALQMELPNMK